MKPNLSWDACENSALYAMGSLSVDEAERFELHLAGCARCQEELPELRETVAVIGTAVVPVVPAVSVRERLMRSVTDEAQCSLLDKLGIHMTLASKMDWQAGPIPGMDIKLLFSDKSTGYSTMLLRMAAGGAYPRHRHAEMEELFLLEGEMELEDVTMRAGDYCRAEAGSEHGSAFTRTGCVLLVHSCDRDEILA